MIQGGERIVDHVVIKVNELQDTDGSDAWSMTKRELFMPNGLTTPQRKCLAGVRRRLGEGERGFPVGNSSCTIFRISPTLCGINPQAEQPEIVSIGPYHRGRNHLLEFEEHKWFFLRRLLRRTSLNEAALIDLLAAEENAARSCYSEPVLIMSTGDFVEMMLLDCCFVLELLLHIFRSGDAINEDDPVFTRPWIIPILIGDLLKLENQIPFFLLNLLFDFSSSAGVAKTDSLCTLALRVFHLAYPRSEALLEDDRDLQCTHLLDLFHSTLLPPKPCVTRLRPSGIKFKPRKTENFLDISFRKRVLEIPSITINDFTTTVPINCVAMEQSRENSPKYVTDYVSFMRCLINQPKDVSLLCSDGIITGFSRDDKYVANLFNKLGESVVFNVHDCYLSKQFQELESYYHSNWANMMRTYFSSPWSVISVLSAFLVILLSTTQTVFAVLSYRSH